MLYPTETGWAEAQKFFDEALAGVRAHGLDATMVSTGGSPNMKNLGKLKGATEHRPGHLHLQRPHAGRRRCRHLGRLRAQHLFHRGQPRRARPRHPRCRLENADLGHRRRARRPRPDPRTSGGADRALCRGARFPRSCPQQHPAECRRRRADRAQSRLRRRQHDGRGGDGARRRDHRHAAGRSAGSCGRSRRVGKGALRRAHLKRARMVGTLRLPTLLQPLQRAFPPRRRSQTTPAADSRRSALPSRASRRRRRRRATCGS